MAKKVLILADNLSFYTDLINRLKKVTEKVGEKDQPVYQAVGVDNIKDALGQLELQIRPVTENQREFLAFSLMLLDPWVLPTQPKSEIPSEPYSDYQYNFGEQAFQESRAQGLPIPPVVVVSHWGLDTILGRAVLGKAKERLPEGTKYEVVCLPPDTENLVKEIIPRLIEV